jgi:hypothetical protein
MSVKNEALTKALRTLDALGAKYKVVTATGEEFGDLVVKKAPSGKPSVPRNDYKHLGYVEVVSTLKVGDVAVLPVPEELDKNGADKYRGTVASKANQLFGRGSAVTAWAEDRRAIEILRIA